MAAAENTVVRIERKSPTTVEAERDKAQFDSQMAMIRFHVKHADRDAGEYLFRQMMEQCKVLSRRYGFRVA